MKMYLGSTKAIVNDYAKRIESASSDSELTAIRNEILDDQRQEITAGVEADLLSHIDITRPHLALSDVKYITETETSGSDVRVEVFDTLDEAMSDAAEFTSLGGYTTAVADVLAKDLNEPGNWASYGGCGHRVYAEYRNGAPDFGFTPQSIASDLEEDTCFDFESSTYVWRHDGETYRTVRDMSDLPEDYTTEDLYATEIYEPLDFDSHFAACVEDIYEQAFEAESRRAGLLV